MKTQQTFDAMVENKLNTLMPYLVKTTRGDEDLIQEGAIGIWESMKEQAEAIAIYEEARQKSHTSHTQNASSGNEKGVNQDG